MKLDNLRRLVVYIDIGRGIYFNIILIKGYYCLFGIIADDQYLCILGTYSEKINLLLVDQCDVCLEGKYCEWGISK